MIFEADRYEPKSVQVVREICLTNATIQFHIAKCWYNRSGVLMGRVCRFSITDKNFIIVTAACGGDEAAARYFLLSDDDAKKFLSAVNAGCDLAVSDLDRELKAHQGKVISLETDIRNAKELANEAPKIDLGLSPKTKTEPPPEIKLPKKGSVNDL